jgi:arylsulfatase A-like enzyme
MTRARTLARHPSRWVLAGLLLVGFGIASCDREASRVETRTAGSDAPSEPPNVLFILADDLRWDALGAYGNRDVRTPHIDRLAAAGARLTNFHVATPVCSPSRANFMTGLYSHEPGITFFDRTNRFARPRIAASTETVATHLARAGYATGFIGKAHLGGNPRRWGFGETPMFQPGFAFGEAPEKHKVLHVHGVTEPLPRNTTPRFADAAIEFLSAHAGERWFLWLAFAAPHSPYDYDPAFAYTAEDLEPPPGHPPGEPLAERAIWRGYYSEVSALDAHIGRILDYLDASGDAENTVVVFTSDNGVMLGSHGLSEKSIWFEESTRVPAIVRWPGRTEAGVEIDAPTSSVDFLPTVLDIAGLPAQRALSGMSLRPTLLRPGPLPSGLESEASAENGGSAERVVFSEAYRAKALGGGVWSMARDRRFKLALVRGTDEAYFYDLRDDPHELHNRIDRVEYARDIERLRARLAEWTADSPATTDSPSSR